MSLVVQILVLMVVLAGLITTIMSVKNWHWAQMLLLLGIFFSAIGTLLLGLEVYRIHRNFRKGMPATLQQIADVTADVEAFKRGTRDPAVIGRIGGRQENGLPFDQEAEGRFPSREVWTRRLQDFDRERGRVWRGVTPAGRVDPATGRIAVKIAKLSPHGLEKDAIVYAFEPGEPNAANPDRGAQYLGDFRVVEAGPEGALLESVTKLDNRTGARLDKSAQAAAGAAGRKGWSLYETIPADRHELFAGLSKEKLQQMLPPSTVEQYIRHGSKATEDDDQFHRAGFDDRGRRVGPDDADKAVEWRYERPLRDYGYLFGQLTRERTIKQADVAALKEDIAKLKGSDASAQRFGKLRTEEIRTLGEDLAHMQNDRKAIESLRDAVSKQLSNARQLLDQALKYNSQLARELADRQLGMMPAGSDAPAAVPSEVFLRADGT